MTRFRKTAGQSGRVVFVGAGPGDPGMLTDGLAEARHRVLLILGRRASVAGFWGAGSAPWGAVAERAGAGPITGRPP